MRYSSLLFYLLMAGNSMILKLLRKWVEIEKVPAGSGRQNTFSIQKWGLKEKQVNRERAALIGYLHSKIMFIFQFLIKYFYFMFYMNKFFILYENDYKQFIILRFWYFNLYTAISKFCSLIKLWTYFFDIYNEWQKLMLVGYKHFFFLPELGKNLKPVLA